MEFLNYHQELFPDHWQDDDVGVLLVGVCMVGCDIGVGSPTLSGGYSVEREQ